MSFSVAISFFPFVFLSCHNLHLLSLCGAFCCGQLCILCTFLTFSSCEEHREFSSGSSIAFPVLQNIHHCQPAYMYPERSAAFSQKLSCSIAVAGFLTNSRAAAAGSVGKSCFSKKSPAPRVLAKAVSQKLSCSTAAAGCWQTIFLKNSRAARLQ